MVTVSTADVLDGCPSGTLVRACYCWSTYTAISLIEGTYFLTPEGVSPWESIESLSFTAAEF